MPRFLITFILAVIALAFAIPTNAQSTVETKEPQRGSVRYGLVVDNSGSFRPLLEKVINLVSDIVDENGPDDEAFLVTFVDSRKIFLRQDFTFKKSELHDAAENMYIEGGQTAILDALQFSAEHIVASTKTASGQSHVLVLVTDGDDRDSYYNTDQVLKFLKDAHIRVFVVGIAEGKVYTKLLDRLTKETGGVKYLPKNKAEITTAIKDLSAAIRAK